MSAIFVYDMTPAPSFQRQTPREGDGQSGSRAAAAATSGPQAQPALAVLHLRQWALTQRKGLNKHAFVNMAAHADHAAKCVLMFWTHYCAQSMSWYSLDLSKQAFTPSSSHSFFAWSKNSWRRERRALGDFTMSE